MSDYYSYKDPKGPGAGNRAIDYDTGGSSSWLWAVVIVVALILLVAIGSSGGVEDNAVAPPATPAVEATPTQPAVTDQ